MDSLCRILIYEVKISALQIRSAVGERELLVPISQRENGVNRADCWKIFLKYHHRRYRTSSRIKF